MTNADRSTLPAGHLLNRRFGLLVGGVLLLLASYRYFRHQTVQPWLLGIGVALVLLAWLFPRGLTLLRISWEKLGHWLGLLNTYILLTLVYVLICIPLGWLLRLLGNDPLRKKWHPKATTYWESAASRSSMKFQF